MEVGVHNDKVEYFGAYVLVFGTLGIVEFGSYEGHLGNLKIWLDNLIEHLVNLEMDIGKFFGHKRRGKDFVEKDRFWVVRAFEHCDEHVSLIFGSIQMR